MEEARKIIIQHIGGEIICSRAPHQTMKKWMDIFGATASELANEMGVTPSVISDYERGRRPSPRIDTIKRFAEALISLDERKGGKTIQKYATIYNMENGVIDIHEFNEPVNIPNFIKIIEGECVCKFSGDRRLFGSTIVNSKKAILSLNAFDFLRLYGWTTERAIIFTEITYGRSPMIAIRVHPMKPAAVVYHKPAAIDPLAQRLAEIENIPLIITRLEIKDLIERLKEI